MLWNGDVDVIADRVSDRFMNENDFQTFWELMIGEFEEFGVTNLFYAATSSLLDARNCGFTAASLWKSTYPERFQESHEKNCFLDNEEIAGINLFSTEPHLWHLAKSDRYLEPMPAALSSQVSRPWIPVGVTIPVYLPKDHVYGGMGLSFGGMTADEFSRAWREMSARLIELVHVTDYVMRDRFLNNLVTPEPLNVRDLEYLKWVCSGLQAAMIAQKMGISTSRVAQITKRVKDKLNASTMGHAVYKARSFGLVPDF